MKTVIVTGGAGYIGCNVVSFLLQEGYRVICLDNLLFGGAGLLGAWGHPNFRFERCDINDHDHVDRILNSTTDCYGLVHLAAIVGDPACSIQPELARKTNHDASLHLIETARVSGVQRFVFASTCSNYGKMENSSGFVDESSPLAPVSLYAELKVEIEKLLLETIERSSTFAPTCLRFATVYGLSPRMRFDLTVNEFARDLALEKELLIFGEQFWRPYCHVRDFARAIANVLEQPIEKVAYNVFNIGDTDENYTKKMIADELLNQLPASRISYVKRDEDPRDYRVTFEKAKKELDFAISKTVPEGIKEIVNCIQNKIISDPNEPIYSNTPPKSVA